MAIPRKATVQWQSQYNESKWFKGVVRRVIDDRAIVDDGSDRTYRVIPTHRLVVTNDPTKVALKNK
jgi:hypothetical protein